METTTEAIGRDLTSARSEARRFWQFWSASTVSFLGDAISTVALPLTAVTVLHASALQVSLLTAASYAAWVILGLPAGVLVESLPLRQTQIAMDVVRASALLSVPLAAAWHLLSMPQLIAVALFVGLASVVFDVGNSTFLVSVVAKSELAKRNSLTDSTQAVIQAAGPSLAGVLVQLLSAPGAIVCDVVSYVISASVLTRLPRVSLAARDHRLPLWQGIGEGCRYVLRHPIVRPCLLMASSANFVCGGLIALTPVYLVRTLHTPLGLVGLLYASEGVGTLVGAALTPRLAARFGSARALLNTSLVGALLALLTPIALQPPTGMIFFALGNAGYASGVVALSVLARTHRQQTTPVDLLPRVMATTRFISWGVIPLGAAFAGSLATFTGVRAALAAICFLALLVSTLGWKSAIARVHELADLRSLQAAQQGS